MLTPANELSEISLQLNQREISNDIKKATQNNQILTESISRRAFLLWCNTTTHTFYSEIRETKWQHQARIYH